MCIPTMFVLYMKYLIKFPTHLFLHSLSLSLFLTLQGLFLYSDTSSFLVMYVCDWVIDPNYLNAVQLLFSDAEIKSGIQVKLTCLLSGHLP